MYSIVASVRYLYCAIRGKYTEILTHNRASVKGIIWLAEAFKRVATKTETITRPSAFISLPPHCVTLLYGLLNAAKPEYRGIIAQTWSKLAILECCSRKDVTQSAKWLCIQRWMIGGISGLIIVVGEMHFILQMKPSKVPTAGSSGYCLASRLSISSPWVVSIIPWKYSW